MEKKDIKNTSLEELESYFQKLSLKAFHAKQIFSWIYEKGIDDFDLMSDLSLGLREIIKKNFYFSRLTLKAKEKSKDGTIKFIFKLEDNNLIESVSIPSKERNTVCISTQVGCRFCCNFCYSGIFGFKRNLTTAEITNQVIFIKNLFKDKKITNLVFMGTGEPLDNYENALKAVRIFNSSFGLNIAARSITISTSGLIPGIKRLAKEGLQLELSVSLHASDNKTRNALMPINKNYPLEELIKCCREYFLKTKRQITFEYILIHNLNCGPKNAEKLGRILKGFDFKLNLIPYNRIKEFDASTRLSIDPEPLDKAQGSVLSVNRRTERSQRIDFEPPTKLEVLFFQNELAKQGIRATLRLPRGKDINAACGQLRYYTSGSLRFSER